MNGHEGLLARLQDFFTTYYVLSIGKFILILKSFPKILKYVFMVTIPVA